MSAVPDNDHQPVIVAFQDILDSKTALEHSVRSKQRPSDRQLSKAANDTKKAPRTKASLPGESEGGSKVL